MRALIKSKKWILGFSTTLLMSIILFTNSAYASVIVTKVMTSELKMYETSSFVATGSPQTFKCFAAAGSTGDCYISRQATGYYNVLDVGNHMEPNYREVTVTLPKGYVYNISAGLNPEAKRGDKVTATISD